MLVAVGFLAAGCSGETEFSVMGVDPVVVTHDYKHESRGTAGFRGRVEFSSESRCFRIVSDIQKGRGEPGYLPVWPAGTEALSGTGRRGVEASGVEVFDGDVVQFTYTQSLDWSVVPAALTLPEGCVPRSSSDAKNVMLVPDDFTLNPTTP
ncbi:hypothetical protein [Sinosporangium siamense]|uniref:hypothetical protein n=1 Tax=Sinosporangium siamense TaxID=1367973 RepID=UPI00194F2B5E|nr:hypothetical protein [Sinosporangium siamense]